MTILNLQRHHTKLNRKKEKIKKHLGFPSWGVMLTSNLNFVIVLNAIIATLLSSTQPIHFNTKILDFSPFFLIL
jgi:hypothetical protein